jgi:hypothetical protein
MPFFTDFDFRAESICAPPANCGDRRLVAEFLVVFDGAEPHIEAPHLVPELTE